MASAQYTPNFFSITAQPNAVTGAACFRMPPEVLQLVFSYLDVQDVKNVRLVSRMWTPIAVPFLFSQMNILADRPDVSKLLLVTKDQALKARINLLRLPNVLLNPDEYGELIIRLQDPDNSDLGRPFLEDHPKIIQDVKQCRRWLRRKRSTKQTVWDGEVLTQVFGQLQKLDALEVCQDIPFAFHSSAFRGYNSPFFHYWLSAALDTYDDDFERVRRISILMQALKDTQLKLKSLKIEHLTPRWFEQKPIAIKNFSGSLDFLHVLDVATYQGSTLEHDCQLFNKNFGLFVRSAPQLRELHICLGNLDEDDDDNERQIKFPKFSISYAFGGHTWLSLGKFHLTRATVHGTELMEFLGRHANTLTEVELSDISLINGNFREVFEFCRDSLSLSKFFATGTFRRAEVEDDGLIFSMFVVFRSTPSDDFQSDEVRNRTYRPGEAVPRTLLFKRFVVNGGSWPLTSAEDELDAPGEGRSAIWDEILEERGGDVIEDNGTYGDDANEILPLDATGKPLDMRLRFDSDGELQISWPHSGLRPRSLAVPN